MSNSSHRAVAVVALVSTTLIWAAPPLFQKYLLTYFNNPSQNFYRYLIGFLVSIPFLVARLRAKKLRLQWKHFTLMLLPAAPNILNQYAAVEALNHLMPGFASIFVQLRILFAIGLSYLVFSDERWLFRSGLFLAGFVLALAGGIGLALLKPMEFDAGRFYRGIFWLVASGPAWALYSVMIKKTTGELGVNISFSLISLWTVIGFLVICLFEGGLGAIAQAPWQANTVLVVSAVFAIGLAHPLYYFSVRRLGISVCQIVLLATPVATVAFSAFLFREFLTPFQWVFGGILLAGAALAVLARKPAPIDPAREISTAKEA